MLKSALLVTTGIIIGAGSVSVLAQGNAKHYTVAEINVKDRTAYEKDLPEAIDLIKKGGGVYVAGGFDKAMVRTGTPAVANRYVIQVYPDKAASDKTWDGGLSAWIDKHKNIADFRIIEVQGVEMK